MAFQNMISYVIMTKMEEEYYPFLNEKIYFRLVRYLEV